MNFLTKRMDKIVDYPDGSLDFADELIDFW